MNFREEVFEPLLDTIIKGFPKEFETISEYWYLIPIMVAILFLLSNNTKKRKHTKRTKHNSNKELTV